MSTAFYYGPGSTKKTPTPNDLALATKDIPSVRHITFFANSFWREMILGKIKDAGLCRYDAPPIKFSDFIPKFASKWQFPKERFTNYEPPDEVWCRYFGIGKLVESQEPLIYAIDEDAIKTPIYNFPIIQPPTFLSTICP